MSEKSCPFLCIKMDNTSWAFSVKCLIHGLTAAIIWIFSLHIYNIFHCSARKRY